MLKGKNILLCDIDGVIIKGGPKGKEEWCNSLKEDLDIDPLKLKEKFFAVYWFDIIRGHRDLKDCLEEALPKIKPGMKVETMIEYWFEKDSGIDSNFLNLLEKSRESGLQLYIATDQEHFRKEYMCKTLGFEKIFKDVFYSANIGFTKEEDGFWECLKEKLSGYSPSEMFFIDDREKNIKMAEKHGIDGYLYTNFEQALKDNIFQS